MAYTYDETKLKPSMKESPTATYEGASVWPQTNSARVSFIKKFINEAFGEKYEQHEIETILLKNKEQFFDEYKQAYNDAKEEDMKEMPSIFSEVANFSYSYTIYRRCTWQLWRRLYII